MEWHGIISQNLLGIITEQNITIKKDKLTITILVYNDDVYFKASDNSHVVSNFNITGKEPFKISVTGKASRNATLEIQSW